MFNLWSTNGGAPTSSAIRQANEHMEAMLKRILDLELRVQEQTELMARRDAEHAAKYQSLEKRKDNELAAVHQELLKSKELCQHMEGLVKARDVQIAYLFHRCSYLDEAASYVPLLDQLSQCLKNSFASPPPKLPTLKTAKVEPHNDVINGVDKVKMIATPGGAVKPTVSSSLVGPATNSSSGKIAQ